ncbi:MAG: bifunctional metallophosphatase/5'-nucleotidase [Actinobacteria bacterium HGW-Actinobacteria-2]|nr:MAG: bifunctional metallophosphatase/5'-nucleotidase [Actinobacteria bacterium HGW-Actinobacteria-2]
MRTSRIAVGLAAVVALAFGITPNASAHQTPPTRTTHLTLLATTDVHGNINNWDYFRNAPYTERTGDTKGLASVASIVKSVRAEKGARNVVVVDNGDFLQGTPLDYYFAVQEPVTQTRRDHPMAVAYNTIGYDAQVVGNHEFNYGLPLLNAYTKDADFPVLGANAINVKTGRPYLKPFTMITRAVPGGPSIKIGVIGLTNPGSAIWDKANVEGKVRFDDMVTTAAKWVPVVRHLGADIVVVLAHGGVGGGSSYGTDLPAENPDDVIAAKVPGIDVVVVGHTHLDVPETWVTNEATGKQVLLTQPKNWGQTVSEVDFTLSAKGHGDWTVDSMVTTSLRSKNYTEDAKFTRALKYYNDKTLAYVSQVVAQSTQELPATESRYKDTAIIDFIQNVQTETVKSAMAGTSYASTPVLSIAAPFSRTAVFPQGDVTIRDIAGLYIYDNTLQARLMTGQQVKDYLEYSAKYFAQVPAGGTFDPATMTNAPGGATPDYNYDIISGINYDIDLSQPQGSRIVNMTMSDGTPVAMSDQFVVAVNNYRASGGGNFPHIASAPVVYNDLKEIRQLLIDWSLAKGTIDPADFYVPSWRLTINGVVAVP